MSLDQLFLTAPEFNNLPQEIMVATTQTLFDVERTTTTDDPSAKFERITGEIIEQYKADKRVWVIGFSGGKDSTTLLQLIFYALQKLSETEELHKDVHVLCNDTLVENPAVARYIDDTLAKIRAAGESLKFPLHVAKVTPTLADSFWVNLIGKGYPSPNRFFRWCTERMKINPTSAYIKTQISEHGEAIILLGTRKAESTNRAHSMKQYERKGQRLRRHTLPGAFVFAPIADLSDNEIWMVSSASPEPVGRGQPQALHALPQRIGRRMSACDRHFHVRHCRKNLHVLNAKTYVGRVDFLPQQNFTTSH